MTDNTAPVWKFMKRIIVNRVGMGYNKKVSCADFGAAVDF